MQTTFNQIYAQSTHDDTTPNQLEHKQQAREHTPDLKITKLLQFHIAKTF